MKTHWIKSTSLAITVMAAVAWGCKDEKDQQLTPAQKQANAEAVAKDNSQMISATQEMMDATAGGFADQGITNGRKSSEREGTWGCKPSVSGNFKLDTSIKDSLIYSGSITLDYGDGSSCPDSTHRRAGKITDNFIYAVSLKNNWAFTSSETITFDGFRRDTVSFDGNVIVKSATKSPTTVEAQGAKITYVDGTFASWNGLLSFEYQKANKCRDWGGSEIDLTGSISGTSRSHSSFSASISREIVFKNTCAGFHGFIPVSGTVDITSDGAASTLDYGDGTCDKSYTITSNGTTTAYVWEKI